VKLPPCFTLTSSSLVNREPYGVGSKSIDSLAQERPMEGSLTDLSVRSLAADVTLVTYRAVGRESASGNEWHSLRSSVWKLTDGRWQMIFHQGTPTRAPQPQHKNLDFCSAPRGRVSPVEEGSIQGIVDGSGS